MFNDQKVARNNFQEQHYFQEKKKQQATNFTNKNQHTASSIKLFHGEEIYVKVSRREK